MHGSLSMDTFGYGYRHIRICIRNYFRKQMHQRPINGYFHIRIVSYPHPKLFSDIEHLHPQIERMSDNQIDRYKGLPTVGMQN